MRSERTYSLMSRLGKERKKANKDKKDAKSGKGKGERNQQRPLGNKVKWS